MSRSPRRKPTKKQPTETRSTLLAPVDAWLIDALGGGQMTSSRQVVNAKSALNVPAWLAAIRCISEDTAKLPIGIYKRGNGTSTELPDHPLNYLLNTEPNTDMSAMSYWETTVAHALAWSGGYSEIIRDATGRAVALYPLDPTTVHPVRDTAGRLVYRVQMAGRGEIVLQQADVFHVHGLSFDGICGYDTASLGKETVGNALAALKYSGTFFGNGANVGGVISHPNALDPKAREALREALTRRYSGAENGHRLMVLEEGAKFEKTTVDPAKSMMIESLKFSVDDIARIFRIPAHKLGSLDRATFSNIEEQNQNYIDETLTGWTLRIEQEIRRKLLLPSERNLEIRHDFSALLKGDNNSQADYYGKLFLNGFITQNEVARRMNLPQLGPDGDKYYRPVNIQPVDLPPPQPAIPHPGGELPTDATPDAADASQDAATRAAATHEKLLAATLRRLLRGEQDKVRRYSKDFAAEHKIREYYENMFAHRQDEVMEVVESLAINANRYIDARNEARNILNRHIERSVKESTDAALVESWLGARPDEVAHEEIARLVGIKGNI